MATFVTLEDAKAHLGYSGADHDAEVQAKTDQAEAHVMNWCSVTASSKAAAAAWTPATVPPVVIAAILIQTGELDRFRGDDAEGPARPADEPLAPMVRELLRAYHDLVIA
jgi:hypothetical protein